MITPSCNINALKGRSPERAGSRVLQSQTRYLSSGVEADSTVRLAGFYEYWKLIVETSLMSVL